MKTEEIGQLLSRITIKEGMMGGRPIVRGMRFTVSNVLELLASGMTAEQIVEEHPALEIRDIQACLLYASFKLNNTRIIYAV